MSSLRRAQSTEKHEAQRAERARLTRLAAIDDQAGGQPNRSLGLVGVADDVHDGGRRGRYDKKTGPSCVLH